MKKILGLDLGVGSIGWAMVNEAENDLEKSSIIKLGVRVNPLTVDELTNFEKGKSITTNADRTLKRSMRRNLERYKLRRENLIEVLKENHFITDETILTENGNQKTFETYRLRAKSATDEISLEELSRVLLMINKKRGYKSSRKAKSDEEGQLIDGMDVAKSLYDNNWTPGELSLHLLQNGQKYLPDFYRSDLRQEFEKVWQTQKEYYSDILTDELRNQLEGKAKGATWKVCEGPFNIIGIKRDKKGLELKIENYEWRGKAIREKMDLEQLVIVLQEINGQINESSGYLGAISDRSKELFFNKQTVGQYQMAQLAANPNHSLKNQVFYRQDYLDEFETIWERQASFHPELTSELKKEIRDIVIFYQRPLKSCKGLISFCELEQKQIKVNIDGLEKIKLTGSRVSPKSSPLFQDFKIWQILNNIEVFGKGSIKKRKKTSSADSSQLSLLDETKTTQWERRRLEPDEKEILYKELSIKSKISKNDALKLLFDNAKDLDLNYKEIEGNRTQAALYNAYQTIIERSGHGEYDFSKMPSEESMDIVKKIFEGLGYNTDILTFDSHLTRNEFWSQPMVQLWHLLYSYEGDKSSTGIESLIRIISERYGFEKEYAKVIANVPLQSDYGSLSAKAMSKILPYMHEGEEYSEACLLAGYRHSKQSLTREEIQNRVYKDKLEQLPKNSLRNPVVEKILNQMVNVVNAAIDAYGKPDEIRIELARELKKSQKERTELTEIVNKGNKEHEEIKRILENEFGFPSVSRNDIIRYKLYKELECTGFKTLYSNQYIRKDDIFSDRVDIEHIIPQSRLFDDSFSNKTLEFRDINIEKGNATAYDFVRTKYGEDNANMYLLRIDELYHNGNISKSKWQKLKMKGEDIPDGFINRDLRDSQYIAKKAKEMLNELVPFVVATTGSITDRLREDWQLVDVMQELNWDKYNKLGLTYYEERHGGQKVRKIKDWTKRNDHRHHAMDALTIAFTKRSFIQYLNNLNARVQRGLNDDLTDIHEIDIASLNWNDKKSVGRAVKAIEAKELERDEHSHLRFKSPILPIEQFRVEAKKHLENILVSIKAKNKVTTRNVNASKKRGGTNKKLQLTPRGQLHLETIYGSSKRYDTKLEKVNAAFTEEKIMTVAKKVERDALLARLRQYGNDPKKAFTGRNTLDRNPIFLDEKQKVKLDEKVKTVCFEQIFTIRKEVSPDLKLDKVVDPKIRQILKQRLDDFGGDAKKAFVNLDENPIWLNKDKGIAIKRVTITGISNAIALHDKKDQFGKPILDENGNPQPVDFVNTGNNHHVAVYRKPVLDKNGQQKIDENGTPMYEIDEMVVSFFEAVERANQGIPIIDKSYKSDEGWQFLFSMKQNEYFVFPNEESGFNPKEINLLNPDNYAKISPNLFRVQKIGSRDYTFRHQLETTVEDKKELKGITFKRITNISSLNKIVKVRVNHIGQIVSVGEY